MILSISSHCRCFMRTGHRKNRRTGTVIRNLSFPAGPTDGIFPISCPAERISEAKDCGNDAGRLDKSRMIWLCLQPHCEEEMQKTSGVFTMKISTKGRYALRMLLRPAEHKEDGFILFGMWRSARVFPRNISSRSFPVLSRAGLLSASRGFQGGYRLVREPDEYTVGEILRLSEGDLFPVACLAKKTESVRTLRRMYHTAGVGRPVSCYQRISGRHDAAGYSLSLSGP